MNNRRNLAREFDKIREELETRIEQEAAERQMTREELIAYSPALAGQVMMYSRFVSAIIKSSMQ